MAEAAGVENLVVGRGAKVLFAAVPHCAGANA